MFFGVNVTPLSYVARKQVVPKDEAENQSNRYNNIDKEMNARYQLLVAGIVGTAVALEANGPFIGSYLTDLATALGKLTAIFAYYTAWIYCKVSESQHNVIKGYLTLYHHHIRRNNVDHMEFTAEKILQNLVYYWDQKNKTFEGYITIHNEQHTIL